MNSGNPLFGRSGNSEGPFDNDLVYIPVRDNGTFNDPAVVFASGFDQAGFAEFLDERGLGGGIVPRNSDESTWNQRWDLRYEQELPFTNWAFDNLGYSQFDSDRLSFVVDVFNFANLLNDEWGTINTGARFDAANLVNADLVSVADVNANGIDGASALLGDMPRTVCTSQTACVYRFNSFSPDPESFANQSASVYQIRLGLRYEF